MPDRGDVLRLKRRLGFEAKGEEGSVVVVQARAVTDLLPTTVIVPLDPAVAAYHGQPWVVPVSAQEIGAAVDHVAVVPALRQLRIDLLAPGVVGRLKPPTLRALDRILRLVLDLP